MMQPMNTPDRRDRREDPNGPSRGDSDGNSGGDLDLAEVSMPPGYREAGQREHAPDSPAQDGVSNNEIRPSELQEGTRLPAAPREQLQAERVPDPFVDRMVWECEREDGQVRGSELDTDREQVDPSMDRPNDRE